MAGSIDAGCQSKSKRKRITGLVIGGGFGDEYNPLRAHDQHRKMGEIKRPEGEK